jgi:hypothetical protein
MRNDHLPSWRTRRVPSTNHSRRHRDRLANVPGRVTLSVKTFAEMRNARLTRALVSNPCPPVGLAGKGKFIVDDSPCLFNSGHLIPSTAKEGQYLFIRRSRAKLTIIIVSAEPLLLQLPQDEQRNRKHDHPSGNTDPDNRTCPKTARALFRLVRRRCSGRVAGRRGCREYCLEGCDVLCEG